MRVLVATLVAAAAAVGCGSASSAPSAPSAPTAPSAVPETALTVTYWPTGSEKPAGMKRWTLRCDPAGGSHVRPAWACGRLVRLQRPFAALPKDVACTQVYGGPQQALVTGSHRGQRVWARLSLRDGCEIARFRKLSFLVPGLTVGAAGATS